MELPDQPAHAPLPPSRPARDVHADGDVEEECCRNIHCACAQGLPVTSGLLPFRVISAEPNP